MQYTPVRTRMNRRWRCSGSTRATRATCSCSSWPVAACCRLCNAGRCRTARSRSSSSMSICYLNSNTCLLKYTVHSWYCSSVCLWCTYTLFVISSCTLYTYKLTCKLHEFLYGLYCTLHVYTTVLYIQYFLISLNTLGDRSFIIRAYIAIPSLSAPVARRANTRPPSTASRSRSESPARHVSCRAKFYTRDLLDLNWYCIHNILRTVRYSREHNRCVATQSAATLTKEIAALEARLFKLEHSDLFAPNPSPDSALHLLSFVRFAYCNCEFMCSTRFSKVQYSST